jgi:hypothetical protein
VRDIDADQLAWLLNRNRILGTSGALVAYELARRILTVDALNALVEAGEVVIVVDPDTGMPVYSSKPEYWVR